MGKSNRKTLLRLLTGVFDPKAARKALRSKSGKQFLFDEWQKASEYPVSQDVSDHLKKTVFPWIARTPSENPQRPGYASKAVLMKAAAFFLILILSGSAIYWFRQVRGEEADMPMRTYATNRGERKSVLLPDGSRVWLNAASGIRFPAQFGEGAREVFLEGEGCFEVVKSATPFVVFAGEINVRVLGTRFNVNAYPEKGRIETTLLEGRVEVSKEGADERVHLEPGQRASLMSGSNTFQIEEVNTERVSSWVNGRLSFDDTPLTELIPELSRWFDVPMKLADTNPYDPHLSLTIKEKYVEEVLELLKLTAPITYETVRDTIVVITTADTNQPNQQ
jgi:ferric-dicitrate binding protein FerR (iron transport regulator)